MPTEQRGGLVALFAETARAFHAAAPTSLVMSWHDTNATTSARMGLDVAALSRELDYVAVMAYDMYGLACGSINMHPPFPRCPRAGANAPFQFVKALLAEYPVPPARTLMVLPAVGFWFDSRGGRAMGRRVI